MKAQLILTFRFGDAKVAHAISASLSPDNVRFPRGLKMTMSRRRERLTVALTSTASLETLLSTADEVLSHVQLAAKALNKTV